MRIAVHGLGRMGNQIARKLAESGSIEVIAHNRSPQPIDDLGKFGVIKAYNKKEVMTAFGDQPPIIWLMLPADVTNVQLDEWLKLLPSGSLIIDGSNSDFNLTVKHNKLVLEKDCSFIDVGVSGGIWGYQQGFSMMVGTDNRSAFEHLKPALAVLAQPTGQYAYLGPSGSGHFVKMTHNAIEYGMMESLAEGYRLLKEGPYPKLDLAQVADVWQHHSVITSWLNELIKDIMSENPELKGIDGVVAQNGEALWALKAAQEYQLDMPAIDLALKVRLDSQKGQVNYATKLLGAMRHKFGGHDINGRR